MLNIFLGCTTAQCSIANFFYIRILVSENPIGFFYLLHIDEISSGKMFRNIFSTLQSFASLLFRKRVWQIEFVYGFLEGHFFSNEKVFNIRPDRNNQIRLITKQNQ